MLVLNPVPGEVPSVRMVRALGVAEDHCAHLAIGIPGLQLLLHITAAPLSLIDTGLETL